MTLFRTYCRFLSVVILFISLFRYANGSESVIASGSITSIQTTSKFRFLTFLGSYKTNSALEDDIWNLGLKSSLTNGQVSQSNFSFQHFQLTEQMKKGPFEFIVAPGIANRNMENIKSSQIFEGFLGFNSAFETTGLQIEVGSKSYGEDLQSISSIQENLRGPYYRLAIQKKITEAVKLNLISKTLYLSDGNQRTDNDLSLMYGIATSWPWIWVGLGTGYLTNSKANQPYWSPRQFYSYGPRLDIAAPIYRTFSFAVGLNLNKFQDIDFRQGQGFYSNSKIVYGEVGKLRYEVGLEAIQSEQNGNVWRSQAVALGMQCPF